MSSNYSPLSSINGKIEQLLITLPPGPDSYLEKYYQELKSTFGTQTDLILYRNYEPPRNPAVRTPREDISEMDLEEQLHAIMESRKVLSFIGEENFHQDFVGDLIEHLKQGAPIANTEWAQDPFSILQNRAGDTIFLQPLFSRRYMDKFISLWLASDPNFHGLIKPTQLLLEGGNILANRDYLLVGKDLLAHNLLHRLRKRDESRPSKAILEDIIDQLKTEFGVSHILIIGFDRSQNNWQNPSKWTYQPAFHLDLFLNFGGIDPDGKQILFMGSPRLALELIDELNLGHEFPVPNTVLSQFDQMETFWSNYHATRQPGMPEFRIVQLPLFFYHRILYSWNNCLVESYQRKQNAYLPNYLVTDQEDHFEQLNPPIRHLQAYVQMQFEKEGFTKLNWIGPGKYFRKLAQMRGSLHCITKVLKRSQCANS